MICFVNSNFLLLLFCFTLKVSTFVPCDWVLKPTCSDESHCLNSIIPTIYPPPGSPGSPLGPGGPCGPITPPESPYRQKDRQHSEDPWKTCQTGSVILAMQKECAVLYTGRWTRKRLESKAETETINQNNLLVCMSINIVYYRGDNF